MKSSEVRLATEAFHSWCTENGYEFEQPSPVSAVYVVGGHRYVRLDQESRPRISSSETFVLAVYEVTNRLDKVTVWPEELHAAWGADTLPVLHKELPRDC